MRRSEIFLGVALLFGCIFLVSPAEAEPPPVYHNGAPKFVIGVYGEVGSHWNEYQTMDEVRMKKLQSAGFNSFQMVYGNITRIPGLLDLAAQYGIGVTVPIPYEMNEPPSKHYPGSPFDKMIQALKNHSGFLMYYAFDEPIAHLWYGSEPIPILANLNASRQYMRSRGDDHPIWICEMGCEAEWVPGQAQLQLFIDWQQPCDVYGTDVYPVVQGGENMVRVGNQVSYSISSITGGNKPIIQTLQGQGAFEGDSDPSNDGPRPVLYQTRFMAYDAVVHGAKGVFWWGTPWIEEDSQLWLDICKVARELACLKDPLVTYNVASRINGTTVGGITLGHSSLSAIEKTVGNNHYLIVINRSKSNLGTRSIKVDNWQYARNNKKTRVLFENRSVSSTSTTWYDTFGPWAVHIYTDRITEACKCDYDGDGRSDTACYRPSTSTWYIYNSSNGAQWSRTVGSVGDMPVTGDFDGDGKTDTATWNPITGNWHIYNSSNVNLWTRQWGWTGDKPVPGDYDGDGITDTATYRPSTGCYIVYNSSNGHQWTSPQVGESGDVPVPGDYDGDGKTDLAVYRPSTSTWYITNSSTGYKWSRQLGVKDDIPVPGDYDGDGVADTACYRSSTGSWYIYNSSDGTQWSRQWGWPEDIPTPGDYDGDGKTDTAAWRPVLGNWYVYNSSNGDQWDRQWGWNGDIPAERPLTLEFAPPVKSISQVKACPDHEQVNCSGLVTAVFSDCFYIQSSDRTSGIRVQIGLVDVQEGQNVSVIGELLTNDSKERYIVPISIK